MRRPRLAFLGLGWIGRHRLEAVVERGAADIACVCDPDPSNAATASALAGCGAASSLQELLDRDIDGLVIATPSAQHAEQALAAFGRGIAVFCQKPLGRTAAETALVVRAAERADRSLGTDFSYRYTAGMQRIAELVRAGELGELFAADLIFHNAYGPDRPWFYDPRLAGGGCVIDLGIHLVDLAIWLFGAPPVQVSSTLYANGGVLAPCPEVVEDFAICELRFPSGGVARMACSWRAHAGRDAVIECSLYGTAGGAAMRNRDGSFYDFAAERYRGTARELLSAPPDAWGGRAVVAWVERLARNPRFDPAAEELVDVARVIDRIYGRSSE